MRIGMILDKVFPPDPRVENEALALIEYGHEVFLFCLSYNEKEKDSFIKGIEVKRYLSNTIEYKMSALAYTFPFYKKTMARKIRDFIEKNQIDIIHVHDMVVAEAVNKANLKFQLPIVLDLHENRPEIMKTYPHLNKFPGKFLISVKKWKKKEGELVKMADRIVVVTEEAKDELKTRLDINDQKVVVVPNTVKSSFYKDYDLQEKIVKRYENKFVILYLGDTGLRRGLISMIEAIAILNNKKAIVDQIKLVIVGKNSTDVILKRKVEELGIVELVDFEGWQNTSLFGSYLHVSDIGVSPLHRNLHHDTTYANKLFQYMSFGLPVLVSDALAQKNLIEKVNCGLVHREKDAADIAEKILLLYTDKDLSKKLGQYGQQFIKDKFCWEKVSGKLKDLYIEFEKK